MSETVTDIIKGGSLKLIIASFIIGGVFFRFQSMELEIVNLTEKIKEIEMNKAGKSDVDILDRRLTKKIVIINDNTSKIRDLECKN